MYGKDIGVTAEYVSLLVDLPVSIISIAFDLPIALMSRCVPPAPGSTPSVISG